MLLKIKTLLNFPSHGDAKKRCKVTIFLLNHQASAHLFRSNRIKTYTGMGTGGTDASLKSWADAIRRLPNQKIVADPAFLSASTNETQNVFFRTHKVKLQIEIPPGTPMHLTNNYAESEIILRRGTRLDYSSVDVKEMTDSSGHVHKHVTIRCRVKYAK